jgi:hypothetical protein
MNDIEKSLEQFLLELIEWANEFVWYRWECKGTGSGRDNFTIGFRTISPKNLLTLNLRLKFKATSRIDGFKLEFPHHFELTLEDELRRNTKIGSWPLKWEVEPGGYCYVELMKLYDLLTRIHTIKHEESGAQQVGSAKMYMTTFI